MGYNAELFFRLKILYFYVTYFKNYQIPNPVGFRIFFEMTFHNFYHYDNPWFFIRSYFKDYQNYIGATILDI